MSTVDTHIAATALAVAISMKIPVLLWSPPGEGKSSVLAALAKDYGYHLEVVLGSTYEPPDFLGYGHVDDGHMRYATPPWADRVIERFTEDQQKSILFFDEISNSTPAVQAASLRVIIEGVVGDNVVLPKDTRIVAAANPTSINTSGAIMKAPTRNRFLHLDWGLSPEYFNQGMTSGWPRIEFPRLPNKAAFAQKWRLSRTFVGAFALARPNMLSSSENDIIDADDSDEFSAADMAFPSPRMWENVARVYAAATWGRVGNEKIDPRVVHALVEGCVGKAAATEFLSFVAHLDIPRPDPILDGSAKWSSQGKRSDVVYAALGSMFVALEDRLRNGDGSAWTNFGNELVLVSKEDNSDIAYAFASKWLKLRPEGVMPSRDHLSAFSDIINAAK